MKPKLISFDAAGTLIDVRWSPGRFAVECAEEAGMSLDKQVAVERYERLLRSRWPDYIELNRTRDPQACDSFWTEVAVDWARSIGQDDALVPSILEIARERMYGPNQLLFRLYEDVVPCLERLKAENWRMIVISNWDYTLHRFVEILGLRSYFEHVFASLEEGPEKPDPALFSIVSERTGVDTPGILHIGDHPVDDLQGARDSGLQAALLDRGMDSTRPPYFANLTDFAEAVLSCG